MLRKYCLLGAVITVSACQSYVNPTEINFGDDDGPWPNDNECDDPRFAGPGVYSDASASIVGHDATDCRNLNEIGAAYWVGVNGTNGS